MTKHFLSVLTVVAVLAVVCPAQGQHLDIRGQWVGNAQGTIFGAEGSVFITAQSGEDIQGIVQGGNFLGTAKFDINGKIRGNYIFGQKEGHTFQGYLYPDGTIRGLFRAVDGEKFEVYLRRPGMYWGTPQSGLW
ncbi:MAG TPA: hypothetical protein VK463_14740 [Desulfomonilaceae bacterium]|nr:hypothetical protein [Desulfomonilaceae bacterium]